MSDGKFDPLVSIVILCWNRREDVRDVLLHVRAIDYPNVEVIVVDNASEDGSAEMIAGEFPEVSLVRMTHNAGIEGYNAGFERTQGEFVVVLDDDSYPVPDALGRMVAAFGRDEKLGVVAFDVRSAAHYEAGHEADGDGQVSATYRMSFNGAGFGIRRDLFRRIGWYPGEFFLYWNEQDTAFRVVAQGYRIESFSNIVALHKFSPRNRISDRAPFFYTRNAFWLVWKNYPLGSAVATSCWLAYRCFYHSLEQRTPVYLRAMWAAFADRGKLRGLRQPVARRVVEEARVVYENVFVQYR